MLLSFEALSIWPNWHAQARFETMKDGIHSVEIAILRFDDILQPLELSCYVLHINYDRYAQNDSWSVSQIAELLIPL